MDADRHTRLVAAKSISQDAGVEALAYFRRLDSLTVEQKGHQDLVSEADKNVELLIRQRLREAFPDDGIVGEEHAPVAGTSGYTWVIDPIDGTANFLAGIPTWVVVLACVHGGQTQIGVICDPVHDELYSAVANEGAYRNGQPMAVSSAPGLGHGSVGVGYSGRVRELNICGTITGLIEQGSVFYRNASGALSLAYVADGRLLGYVEEHMNAWDYLAGQLLVKEAGGLIEMQDADTVIAEGGRVVVGTPAVFDTLVTLCNQTFGQSD